MTRRLIILFGSFLVLLGAFGVYHLVAGGGFARMAEIVDDPDMIETPGEGSGAMDVPEGQNLYIEVRDDRGRLEAIYIAANWEKKPDGTYLLTRPVVIRYQRDGQRLYVVGNTGEFMAERVARGYNVRRGRLNGKPATATSDAEMVKIYLDTNRDRLPPTVSRQNPEAVFALLEQRPEDLVRIHVDHVEFDNDRQMLRSDSELVIWSKNVHLLGKGLVIRWNENPRELRSMTIQHGEYMAVRNLSENADILSLPGSRREDEKRPPGAPAGGSAPKAAPAKAAGGAGGAFGAAGMLWPIVPAEVVGDEGLTGNQVGYLPPGPEPSIGRPSFRRPADAADPSRGGSARPAAARAGGIRKGATTQPAALSPEAPQGKRKNVFQAEFHGSVNVDYGDRRLRHARKLWLVFDWDSDDRRMRRLRRGPTTRPAPTTRPTTRPAKPKADAEALIITWTGPLTLRPIGYRPDPDTTRYTIQGEGEGIVLSDGNSTARCQGFAYRRPAQSGELHGNAENPVELILPQGQEIRSPQITFNRLEGKARLAGPGVMRATSLRESLDEFLRMSRGKREPTTQPVDDSEIPVDRISWGQSVHVGFEQVEIRRDDGSVRTRQFLNDAVFRGDVELTQGRTGNLVRCPKLTVKMSHAPSGRAVPTRAVASGTAEQRVYARQQGSDIQADEMVVTFKEVVEPPDARAAAKDTKSGKDKTGPRRRIRPDVVTATGGVRISDRRGDRLTLAVADRLVSHAEERTATLYGNPARISQGPNALTGQEIQLEQGTESAVVVGEGTLNFETRRRPGEKTDTAEAKAKVEARPPRPVLITWTKGMEYRGKFNRSEFVGGVQLRSELDEMDCDTLRVLFEKAPDKPKRAAAAAGGPASPALPAVTVRPPGAEDAADKSPTPTETKPGKREDARLIGMEEYSARRISKIIALKDVIVRSRRLDENDPQKRMNRRLRLTAAEQLVYDLRAEEMSVLGPGTLVSEDYRPPEPKDPSEAASTGPESSLGNIERPMQTLFQWKQSMRMAQQARRVIVEGDVIMANRSGDKIKLVDSLNLPPLPDPLPRGRITAMTCQKLIAQFGDPNAKRSARPVDAPSALDAADALTAPRRREESRSGYFDMGPKLGSLDLFRAETKVNMKDGPWQVIGEQVIFNQRDDILILWGYRPGQEKANAAIFYEDPDKGQSQNWASPKITWHRQTDKIVTEEVEAGGVR